MTTTPTHVVARADAGHALSCRVTAANGGGTATATSAALAIQTLPACYAQTGTALLKCHALVAESEATANCMKIRAGTPTGKKRRAACIARAKLDYRRTTAAIHCRSVKNRHKRAQCLARARKLK
jgi:hypothetical protein